MSAESHLEQTVFLTKGSDRRTAITPELKLVVGSNGYIQITERSGPIYDQFDHPVEVAHLDGNRWILISEGKEPLIIEKHEYGWRLTKVANPRVP